MNKSKGILYILTSAFFFATYGIWSRLMSGAFGEFSQAWSRGLLLLIFVLLVNAKTKIFKPMAKKDIKWFALIALVGLNQAPYYFGFEHLSIGTATMLFYAALVVGGYLIGKLFFQEKFTHVKIISLLLAFAGMATIYRFSLTSEQILPASLTIIAGLMGAVSVVMPKKLTENYPEMQIMSSYFLVMFVANGVLSLLLNQSLPPFSQTTAWMAWLTYAIALMIANLSAIKGFTYLEASIGSLVGLAEIIFGIIFGIILFGEALTPGIIIGGILILTSAALPNLKR